MTYLQEIKKAILADLTRLGKEAGLKSFEQVTTLLHLHTISRSEVSCFHLVSYVGNASSHKAETIFRLNLSEPKPKGQF